MKALRLEDIIDIDVLQSILEKFSLTAGVASVAVDYKGEPITACMNFSRYCQQFRNDPGHRGLCYSSDAHGGLEAARSGKAYIYRCHSGLTDMAVPIIFEGQYMGAILAGQVKVIDPSADTRLHPTVLKALENPGIRAVYDEIPYTTQERVEAAAELMYLVANYIVSVGMNKFVHEELNRKNTQLIGEMETRMDLERLLKDAELKLLQSQVNPHFLFNVLNTINSLAIIESATMTSEIVHTLSEMLRYTLKNTFNDLVQIRDEIDYMEKYVTIQRARIGERIQVKVEIPEELLILKTPYMILQPLVANAIVHGLYERPEAGLITVALKQEKKDVLITVSDNGVGIEPARLKRILETEEELDSQSTGVGLRNTHRRLQYKYGEDYGIQITSALGEGTQVHVRIPMGG